MKGGGEGGTKILPGERDQWEEGELILMERKKERERERGRRGSR